MNIQVLTGLAEWLEAGAPHVDDVKGFDMQSGIRLNARERNPSLRFDEQAAACGTVCCMAGALVQFNRKEFVPNVAQSEVYRLETELPWHRVSSEASAVAGLSGKVARALFEPGNATKFTPYTAAQCARTVRHLIATGEVDWSQAGEP